MPSLSLGPPGRDDRRDDQLLVIGVLVIAAVILSIIGISISMDARTVMVPAVDTRVGQDLHRGVICTILKDTGDGKITLACSQGGKR